VLEAEAFGPNAFLAVSGSRAAAAVGRHAGAKVWVVAATGTVLPERLWAALSSRIHSDPEPWANAEELVPIDLVDAVVGPRGTESVADALGRADCPVAPELLREVI
jgi:hypothetical protein